MSEKPMLIFNILDLFHNFTLQIYNIQKPMSSVSGYLFALDTVYRIFMSNITCAQYDTKAYN